MTAALVRGGPAAVAWQLVSSIAAPLFDGGRRRAEVERTRGVVNERGADLSQSLLVAIVDVERASQAERGQVAVVDAVNERVTAASRSLEQAQARYTGGMSDLLPVIIAQQAYVEAVLTNVQARRDLLVFRVELHRALGGTWSTRPPT
jgi:outer membrane protein TolC